jgi:hypothetical protein
VLAAVVVLFLGGRDADPEPVPNPPARTAADNPRVHTEHDHDEPDPPAGLRPEEKQAQRAARTFLDGYLPYSYGTAPATEIRNVTGVLRKQLREAAPRVPAADRELEPRVIALDVVRSRGDVGIDLEATVVDGRRRYSMLIGVRSNGKRWLVVSLS